MAASAASPTGETPPPTMFAWQFTSNQPTVVDNLTLNLSLPTPTLPKSASARNGHATLVRVLAVSLNPADYKVPDLALLGRLARPAPGVPAMDFAGRVVQTTDPALTSGDVVCGTTGGEPGTLAQYVLLSGARGRGQPACFAKVPPELLSALGTRGPEELSGLCCAGLTAMQALLGKIPDAGGGRVIVNGGSGGTGTFAVQVAKRALGAAKVVATCSAANAELVRGLGADEVIDYRAGSVPDALARIVATDAAGSTDEDAGKFDVLMDNAGADADLYFQAHRYLKRRGVYVLVGIQAKWSYMPTLVKMLFLPSWLGGGRRRIETALVPPEQANLEKMLGWVRDKKVQTVIDRVYEKEEAAAAFRTLKTGRARGKLVVSMV